MRKNNNFKYQIVFEDIKNDIESGRLKANEKILSEEKIMEKYNVSRVTVRTAFEALEELGLIVRVRGKGTFVHTRVLEKRINNIISFTESNQLVGNQSYSKVLSVQSIKAPLFVMNYLKTSEEETVWAVKRIRFVNNLTALYEESYWVDSTCGEITVENAENSILKMLEGRDVKPYLGKQEIVAMSANGEIAKNLEISENFPILRSTMYFSTKNNLPVFLSVNYYRTDRISVNMTRILED